MRGPTTLIGIVLTTIVLLSTTVSAGEAHHQVIYITAGGTTFSAADGYTVGIVTGALDRIPLSGQQQAHIVAADAISTNVLVRYQATLSVLIGCDVVCTYQIEVLSEGTFCKEATIPLPADATHLQLYVSGTFTTASSLLLDPVCGAQADFATNGVIDVWLA